MSEPLFIPLGVSQHRSELWLHVRVRGEDRVFKPSQALGLGFLLSIVPDSDHWRRMFPSDLNGRRFNTNAACSYIHRLCIAAGEYKPPADNSSSDSILP